VALSGELADAGCLVRQPLFDLGWLGVVGDCDDEVDEVVHDGVPVLMRWRDVRRHKTVEEI